MLTGIIGNPISHSLSPIIHSHWMGQHNIKSSYNIYQVEKNELTNFIKKLYNNNIKGLNITIPYKRLNKTANTFTGSFNINWYNVF